MAHPDCDIVIVGAGVIGLAIADRLASRASIVVLEKRDRYGLGTSSRNSEVIHAGIYYPPRSLKAELCVEGRDELYGLCEKHGIPYRRVTKLIVASQPSEVTDLERLLENGRANGVRLELLDKRATGLLEPHIRAHAAIFSPDTGIISAHGLMDYFYHSAVNHGATIQSRCEVVGIEHRSGGYRVTVDEAGGRSTITAARVVNAAGLGSDRIAGMAGIDVDRAGYRLHYCKGSYWSVAQSKASLLSRLVYPVPSADSLGIHAVLDLGGRLRFGPDVEYLKENVETYAVSEAGREKFHQGIRFILPTVTPEEIAPDICGIRPKLQKLGEPARDFVITHEVERGLEGFFNLVGIDSPGLTASPAIARRVEALLFD